MTWLFSQRQDLGDDPLTAGLLDYSKFHVEELNCRQRLADELSVKCARPLLEAARDKAPLAPSPSRFSSTAAAVQAKSHVLQLRCQDALAEEFGLNDPLRVVACSGSAAAGVYGATIHSTFSIPVQSAFDESMTDQKLKGAG